MRDKQRSVRYSGTRTLLGVSTTRLESLANDIRSHPPTSGLPRDDWLNTLQEVSRSISAAQQDLEGTESGFKAAKAEAEYNEVVVRSWPRNQFLTLLVGIGSALFSAGGATYIFAIGSPFGSLPAAVLWIVGGSFLFCGMTGLADHERKKWGYFAELFSVPYEYHPLPMTRFLELLEIVIGILVSLLGIPVAIVLGQLLIGAFVVLFGIGIAVGAILVFRRARRREVRELFGYQPPYR